MSYNYKLNYYLCDTNIIDMIMKSKKEYIDLLKQYYQEKARKYGVIKMALFGSVARDEQTEESDVDVAYEGEPNIFLRSRMKRELEALFGCKVDVVRLRKNSNEFEQIISKDLIYV